MIKTAQCLAELRCVVREMGGCADLMLQHVECRQLLSQLFLLV